MTRPPHLGAHPLTETTCDHAACWCNGRPLQEAPAVSISAEQAANDARLASQLRNVPTDRLRWSLDTIKRFDGIVRAELERRGIRVEHAGPRKRRVAP